MTWSEKVMLHINRSVLPFWTLNTYVFFLRSSLSIKSYYRKNVGGLSWPDMTLATWGGVTGRNISNIDIEFDSIMERSQNWTDLWSRISKLRNINFMDSVMDINRWVFQGNRSFGVAMIQTFSDVRSLNVTWWPDMERPGSEIFKTCGEKMYEQMCQKSAENLRGCPNTPTSTRHGLKLLRFNWI